MTRYKFYTINDPSLSYGYERAKELLKDVSFSGEEKLVDVLEYYNVCRLVYEMKKSEANFKIADENTHKKLVTSISKYFNRKTADDIIGDFNSFNNELQDKGKTNRDLISYFEDYLACFERFKFNIKITEKEFEKILSIESIPVHYYLRSNFFTNEYPTQIKRSILSNSKNFELLLSNFTQGGIDYKFPNNISAEEYAKLCIDYIDLEHANLNYLKMLINGIKGLSEYFALTPEIRLLAEKKYENQIVEIMKSERNSTFSYSFEICMNYNEYISSTAHFKTIIDLDWLRDNNEPYYLLSYFRALNYVLINQFYVGLCSYPNLEMSIFERYMGSKTNSHYDFGAYFQNKNSLVLESIQVYQDILKNEFNTSIEKILQFYFNDYINETYNIKFLQVEFPIEQLSIKKKTQDLFILEENLRKQWSLLSENRKIDRELFKFIFQTPRVQELKSLRNGKYFYIDSSNLIQHRIMYSLFSDQTTISYISAEKNDVNFFKLVFRNKVELSEYNVHQVQELNFLIEEDVVTNDNGLIYFSEVQLIKILVYYEIYNYGTVSKVSFVYNNEDLRGQNIELLIDEMVQNQILIPGTSLYTKEESDYLNYILNDLYFDNSLAIRNKYGHGSALKDDLNDYSYSLLVLVVFALKVDQELLINENDN